MECIEKDFGKEYLYFFWRCEMKLRKHSFPDRQIMRRTWAECSLVNQTLFRERACASERGRGKGKYGLAKLARFSRPRQDLVVTNQISDLH